MKKITIGRGRECDIRIDDSTDTVSRRQAVITVTPTGKMEIYDTSSNGTFVNGEKVEKPAGKPIKRGDVINFAHVTDLDWNKVKDPYKSMKITLVVLLLAAIAAVVIYFVLADRIGQTPEPEPLPVVEKTDSVPVESLTLQVPEETTPEVPAPKTKSEPKKPETKEPAKKETSKVIEELDKSEKIKKEAPKNEVMPEKSKKLDDALDNQR